MSITVAGERFIDIFEYYDCDRISPEACCPVLKFKSQTRSIGGAANVFLNIKKLGYNYCRLECNMNDIIKKRIIHEQSNQHIARIDGNDACAPLRDFSFGSDIIVISDYCKGFLSEDSIFNIRSQNPNAKIFIDTKKKSGEWCKYVDFIKINQKEWNDNFYSCKIDGVDIFVTLGAKGVWWVNKNETFPSPEVQVRDVAGCGDTFLAALVFQYQKSNNISKSLEFANQIAAKAASTRGIYQ